MLHPARFLLALLLVPSAPAAALTIDFEEFSHGEIVASPQQSHPGYTLTVENFPKSFNAAVAFDTGVTGSLEPDLQYDSSTGFAAGNIAHIDPGNILIIQANSNCNATHCAEPEDEGRRPAGTLAFVLDEVHSSLSFDLIDIDDPTRERGSITFFLVDPLDLGVEVASFAFADFVNLGQGVVFGNNSANHIFLSGIGSFNAFTIQMGGSGGVDNFQANGIPVPEPAGAALLMLGLAGLHLARRSRRR